MEENTKQTEDYGEPRCFACGRPLIWQNDFMRSEMGICDEDADTKEDAVISVYSFPNCRTTYEVYYPSENELEEYRAYEGQKEK